MHRDINEMLRENGFTDSKTERGRALRRSLEKALREAQGLKYECTAVQIERAIDDLPGKIKRNGD